MNDLTEEYRLAALDWVDKDAAARMLEETKTTVLAQLMSVSDEKSEAARERDVKTSDAWESFIRRMVNARTAANKAKVVKEVKEMAYFQMQAKNATERVERRFS